MCFVSLVVGPDQPVILHLLDLPFCMESLGGVVMEIEDGNYPLVHGVLATDDINKAFTGCDCAVLLGAFPRKQGMERKDLMEKNIGIFKSMGEAVEKNASANIKVLVVGNPANTNALIMSHFAPKVLSFAQGVISRPPRRGIISIRLVQFSLSQLPIASTDS